MGNSIRLERYKCENEYEWNAFIQRSEPSLLIHQRGFMEYHKHKYDDFSVCFRSNKDLVAVIPGTGENNKWSSHRGLTFGGILSNNLDLHTQLSLLSKLNYFLKENHFTESIITVPSNSFYAEPSPIWLYSFIQNSFKLMRTDVNQFIPADAVLPSKKISNAKSAERKGAVFSTEVKYIRSVFKIVQENLLEKYGKEPVHSISEIEALAQKFPNEIKICSVIVDHEIVAGAVVFESKNNSHIQYIAGTKYGKKIRAQDYLIFKIKQLPSHKCLSFGKSTAGNSALLNVNLFNFKKEFNSKTELIHTFHCDLKSNDLPVY
jgi:hypothetical protein